MNEIDVAQERDSFFTQMQLRRALAPQDDEPLYDSDGKRICLDCETRIPQKRLKAMPDAVRCIGCQEKLERRGVTE